MRSLTTRLKFQLREVVLRQAPGNQVQDVLSELTAGPLIAIDDGQVQGDQAESFTRDTVAFDALVALTGPGKDLLRLRLDAGKLFWFWLQAVLERSLRSSHVVYAQAREGGSGSGLASRSLAVSARCWSMPSMVTRYVS